MRLYTFMFIDIYMTWRCLKTIPRRGYRFLPFYFEGHQSQFYAKTATEIWKTLDLAGGFAYFLPLWLMVEPSLQNWYVGETDWDKVQKQRRERLFIVSRKLSIPTSTPVLARFIAMAVDCLKLPSLTWRPCGYTFGVWRWTPPIPIITPPQHYWSL